MLLAPRAGILLALLITLAGCGATAPAHSPRATDDAPRVVLDAMGGDVWAFEREVEGEADAACARVEVERDGERGTRATLEASLRDARFHVVVPLREGDNVLRARCVLTADRVIESAPIRWHVRLEERPRAVVRVVPEDGAIDVDLGGSERAEPGRAEIVSARWSEAEGNPEPLRTADGAPLVEATSMRVALRMPERDGEYVVLGEVLDVEGRRDRAGARFVVEEGRARAVDPTREHAAWIDDAVIYGAVPFLFGQPGLPAIGERLDELDELGVDTVWLAPITDAPDEDYGYAVTDYFDVRDAYGTREDLRELVDAAHARGMRVVMDFVPNHSSDQHPYFVHAREHGERSPYWGFYEREAGGDVTHYFDWENLPNLDYDHPEVRRWMQEALAFWVRELDVDGFRVDAAWGVERRAPEVLAEIAKELYRIDPSVLLIAEARACDPYWERAGFAAGYDWTSVIGRWAWHEPFGIGGDDPGVDVPALRAAIASSTASECARVVRFLDNNDTGERFLTRQGAALHDAALTLLFTLPGLPALFTGAEIGAEYSPYDREEALAWEGGEVHARALARRIALRRELEVLREGELVMLDAEPAGSVLAFARRDPEGAHPPAVVVLELGGGARDAQVSLPSELAPPFASRTLRDALGGEELPIARRAGALIVPLAAYGARVLVGRR